MKNILMHMFLFCFLISQCLAAGHLQNDDFATGAAITGAGGSLSQLLNEDKLWSNSLGEQYSTALGNGDIFNKSQPMVMSQQATPANPAAGSNKLYFKAGNGLYTLDSAGNESQVLAPAGGVLPVANGGTNASSFTAGSLVFAGAGGTSLTENNANLFWDDALQTLFLGARTLPPGDNGVQIVKSVTDPAANYMGVSSDMTGVYTADSVTTQVGVNNVVKTKVNTGVALHGAALNNISLIGRQDAADLGTVDLAGGYFAQFVQGNGAKSTGQYSAYIAGFHSLDNTGTVGSIYDFQALPSTIPAGVVTNRYGIYLAPDPNYTKQNWLSGFSRIGGSSYVAPTHALEVPGEVSQVEALTDSGGAGLIFNESSHTTVTGSNTTIGLQGVATATVDVGAVNDKTVAAVLGTTTRGNGADDGNLHEMDGAYALMFHNSGAAGTTDKAITLGSTLINQQGTITDLYDVKPESVPAGGAVTNHYGLYIEASPFGVTKKNWISGATFMGSGGFSAPVEALELSGNLKMTGSVLDNASTPTIIVNNRQLTYGGGAPSVDWLNDALYDSTSVASIDWGNRFLIDSTGAVALDYSTNGTLQSHADIDQNSHFIKNVTDPVNPQDAATKAYVDAHTSGSGLAPVVVVGDTTMAAGNRYIVNAGAIATLTLPATCAAGDEIGIVGVGAGGWKVATNAAAANQTFNLNGFSSATSASSALDIFFSVSQNDAVDMVCVSPNTAWNAISNEGGNFGIITATCASCTITTVGNFKIAEFDVNDTLVVSAGTGNVQYVVVGGGGSSDNGGNQHGGGGGGVVVAGTTNLTVGSYGVTIGAGGVAAANATNSGGTTSLGAITAAGGGGGQAAPTAGNASSGGPGGNSGGFLGGGGDGTAGTFQVTGGGASSINNGGTAAGPSVAGNGADGFLTNITGSAIHLGGGGGGGTNANGTLGTGGLGGGGNGGKTGVTNAQNGAPNTGGGGGAMGNTGNGGSGVVFAKWQFQ